MPNILEKIKNFFSGGKFVCKAKKEEPKPQQEEPKTEEPKTEEKAPF